MKKKYIIGLLGAVGLGVVFLRVWKALDSGVRNWADSYENFKMDYEELEDE